MLREHGIGTFVYIGGNDSMDTVAKLSGYLRQQGVTDICVMGAPKTVDNDLCEIDHTPGFGSAARFVATAFAELACDCEVYDVPAVTIVEVMGRDSGWLTASAALARMAGGDAPHLIYLPEVPFSTDRFLDDLRAQLAQRDAVIVAVSEGVRDEAGAYVAEQAFAGGTDVFGHRQLSGTGRYLEALVRDQIGCKVRSIELSLVQRCAAHLASATDLAESRQLGATAVLAGLSGTTGRMATLERVSDTPYAVRYGLADIAKVANLAKQVPPEMIAPDGNDVTEDMLRYLRPLVRGEVHGAIREGIPQHLRLR